MSGRDIPGQPRDDNPTIYKDIFFRERLVAKWASFFDCVDWPWSHEPAGIDDGWKPDIVIKGHLEIPCVVKAVDFMRPWSAILPFQEQLERASNAAGNGGFLLLGAHPFGDWVTTHIGLHFTNGHRHQVPALSSDDGPMGLGQLDFIIGGPPYLGSVTGRSYDCSDANINPFLSWKEDVLPIWSRASRVLPPFLRGV
jgi:hypothetical protein